MFNNLTHFLIISAKLIVILFAVIHKEVCKVSVVFNEESTMVKVSRWFKRKLGLFRMELEAIERIVSCFH